MAVERVDLGEVPYPEAVGEMGEWVRQRRAGDVTTGRGS
jgi:lipoyl(octanoyl) transferase